MATDFGTPDAGTHQILMEHRELLAQTAAVEALVERLPKGASATEEWRIALGQLLAELTTKLEQHFAVEVQTTSLEPSFSNAVFAAQLRELDEEHRMLLAAFSKAAQMAATAKIAPARVQGIVLQTIASFREHEAKEDALFRETY